MSEEQLKAFLEKVKADTNLQEKLKTASDADAVVSLAKEEGFTISVDDLKNAQSKLKLSDEELEGMAGGGPNPSWCRVTGCLETSFSDAGETRCRD